MNNKYTGNNNLNNIFYEIISILLADDNEHSIDLKKLLYYGNEKDKNGNLIYVNPYKKPLVMEDLYNNYIYQYNHIFNIQEETKSIVTINFAEGNIRNLNYNIEDDCFTIDIYVHKDMEGIEIDNKRVARSIEISNKIRNLLDGTLMPNGLTLELNHLYSGTIQQTYIKHTLEFYIINVR